MNKLLILLTALPFIVSAQTENKLMTDPIVKGIRFEQGLSWSQVQAKAKAENKYIFVDCYTTWCVPCKKMETEVYPVKEVGDFYNDKFISVKIQMDTSKNDNASIQATYADARYIESHYKIFGYPTLLFFTPDGNILSTTTSGMDANGFIKLGNDALDPKKNYYNLLKNYKEGKRDLGEMSWLARTALQLMNDTAKSDEIAKAYLLNLKKEDWLNKENIEFMQVFTKNSKDAGFHFFYSHTDAINKVMRDDVGAQNLLGGIIYRENVSPVVKKADQAGITPNWDQLASLIQKKYNAYYADREIIAARISWAGKHKISEDYTKYLVIYTEKYGSKLDSGKWVRFGLNNAAWEIFMQSQNELELNKALSWSKRAVILEPAPDYIDTYANILYKLGRKELAIQWEEIAGKLAGLYKPIQTCLEKMKKGEPTWPLK